MAAPPSFGKRAMPPVIRRSWADPLLVGGVPEAPRQAVHSLPQSSRQGVREEAFGAANAVLPDGVRLLDLHIAAPAVVTGEERAPSHCRIPGQPEKLEGRLNLERGHARTEADRLVGLA